jgi:TRAP-type C4-dicarboxylate transport system permease small subunit
MARRVLDALYLGSGYLAGLSLLAIFGLMLALSLGRQVGLNIPAGDDLVSWLMAAVAFLGLAHTFKSGEMIRVELLFDQFSGRSRRLIEILSLGLATVVVGFFAWNAARLTYDSYRFNDLAQGVLPIPLWIPQLAYLVGLVILFVAVVDEFVRVLIGHKPTYAKEPPATAEEVVERAVQSGF